jgi:hypothetical protein
MLTQTEVIDRWNSIHITNEPLIETYDNPFATYDAQSGEYIVEIKSRDKEYDSWIIEKYKFDINLEDSVRTGRDFLYITEYKRKLMVWNINDLVAIDYAFNWHKRWLPKTTDFEDNEVVLKEVGYLLKSYARKY